MNIQLKEWKIIKIKYTLFKKNEKREGNYFDLDFKREFYKNHRSFAIRFYTHIEDENFDLELESIFHFTTDENITEEFKESYFTKINAPAIAYPYLRAYISNLTLQSNGDPVILPTINFVAFHRRIEPEK